MSGFEGQDVRTMVMFGLGEDAQWWVDENKDNPREITRYVLFTAAQFGQLGALKKYMQYGMLPRHTYTAKSSTAYISIRK